MLFSTRGPLAVALAACTAVTATPHALVPAQPRTSLLGLDLNLADLSKPASVNVSLDADLSGLTLVEGVLVDAVVPPLAAVGADVDLVVKCKEGYTRGDITATVSLQELVPSLSLSLKDIEASLDLDLYIGVATTIAVNLFTPVAPIQLPIAGLELSALVYVDLVLSLDAAIDVTAGVYVKLTEDALLEIDILKGEILKASFTGLAVRTLPIEVRIGCAKLQADLRVRVQAGVVAQVDVNDLIPLGIDIPEIGAGLELGVYANLVEYVGLFCDTPSCPLSEESYGLNVGVAAGLDVEVGNLLDLNLAPTVSVGLLTLPTATHCAQVGGNTLVALPATSTPSPSATASVPAGQQAGSPFGSLSSSGSIPTLSASVPVGSFRNGLGGNPGQSSGPALPFGTGSISGSGAPPAPTGSVSGSGAVASSVDGVTGVATATDGSGLVTSTLRSTAYYTITSCAASVPNCPANYQTEQTVTKTVDVYTTVCPVTASITAPASSSFTTSSSAAPKPTSSDVTVVTQVTTLVPCSSTATFTPPAGVTPYSSQTTSGVASSTVPTGGKTGSTSFPTKPTSGSASSTAPTGGKTGSTSSATKPASSAVSSTVPAGGKPSSATGTTSYPAKPTSATASSTVPAECEAESSSTGSTSFPAKPTSGTASSTSPAGGKPGSSTESTSLPTKPTSGAASSTSPAGGETGNYPTGSISYPAGEASTYPGSKPSSSPSVSVSYPAGEATTYPGSKPSSSPSGSVSYPAGEASTYPGSKPSGSVSYPAGEASTYPGSKPSSYPSGSVSYPAGETTTYPGSKPSSYPSGSVSYPAGEASTYPGSKPSGSVSYPAGEASTYPGSKPSSYPAGGVPASSETAYPTYPAGGKPGSGYGNSTVPYPTAATSSYSKPSASLVYQTTKSAVPTYPASTPSATPVAAGAGKVGSGVVGAVVIAMVVAMI